MQLEDSVAVITGGASGLGEATVRNFVKAGAKVAIFDLNEKRGKALADELGKSVMFEKTDVTDEQNLESSIAATVKNFGKITANINCAGIAFGIKTMGKDGPHGLEQFKKVIDINLVGTFNTLRLCAEQMAKNEPDENGERGVIVNTASVAAYDGQKGQVAYSASKGGIVGMTLPIARDLSFYGVRICAIAPGLFLTPLFEGLGEEVVNSLSAQVTFPKRLGKPSEFADMAKMIVQSEYMNGETIRLDGAIRLP